MFEALTSSRFHRRITTLDKFSAASYLAKPNLAALQLYIERWLEFNFSTRTSLEESPSSLERF